MTQSQALSILKTGVNVFLTGEPGSGKTHTVNAYVSYLRERGVELALTASTGIAATHISGMTIHSWSGIGIKTKLTKHDLNKIASHEYIAKRVRRAKVLVIDEVSMLASDTLSMVDAVCREIKQRPEPFGGLQVVLVGDFFQLPPVVREEERAQAALLQESSAHFAYDASVWTRSNLVVCYLTEQYRQDDDDFCALLLAIRRNMFSDHHLQHIEARKIESDCAPAGVPKLFSHNVDVDRVNNEMLAQLQGEKRVFTMTSQGPEVLIAGLKKGCLSPEMLELKINAVVMCTKNNPKEGFVNGTLGTVLGFNTTSGEPMIHMRNGRRIEVAPMDWTVEENGKVRGHITQLPLRLAWAITVHKSQGMSLDAAVMDLSHVFEFGQGYVALSRVRRLSSLYLLGWNERAFHVHPEVLAKDELFRAASEKVETEYAKILPTELAETQEKFLIACGGGSKSISQKKKKLSTRSETLMLWNQGNNISQIAKARCCTEQTVLDHIEKLVVQGSINRAHLSRLLTSTLSRALPTVHAAFRELNTYKLSPVFEKFGGVYSYHELRIARMILNR